MKLVILSGGSCSGRTTVIENIMKKKENFFQLSYDSLKWLFSKYQSGKYYEDIQRLLLSTADTMFKMKYNVLSDSTRYRESRQKLIELAKKHRYEIVEINLEADYEILLKRFNKRIAKVSLNPERKTANFSEKRFRELFDIFQKNKNPSAITFRTDMQSEKEVSESIMKLL